MGIRSDKMYNFQSYLELVTGKVYTRGGRLNDYDIIEQALKEEGLQDELWNYPLTEINHIIESEYDVVLVEINVWNKDTDNLETDYRFYQVPTDMEDEEFN